MFTEPPDVMRSFSDVPTPNNKFPVFVPLKTVSPTTAVETKLPFAVACPNIVLLLSLPSVALGLNLI